MKKFFLFLFIIILIIVGALAYTGFLPGLSPLFAKQKDLGVRPDPEQYNQINEALQREVQLSESEYPYEGMPKYSESISVDSSYSDQQITSVLDTWSRQWSATPFYNVQVKIHEDGTAEASGILKVEKAISLAKELGYTDEQIKKASEMVSFINGDLPVYLKGTTQVLNNDVSSSISQMRVGNITVPEDLKKLVVSASEDAIERRIQQVPELDVESMKLDGGMMSLKGQLPRIETNQK